MALAVNVIDRRGPSNKTRRQLQPNRTKVRIYVLAVYIHSSKSLFTRPSLDKMECFSFISGCVV